MHLDFKLQDGRGYVTYFGSTYPAHVEMAATKRYQTERGEWGTILITEIWLADAPQEDEDIWKDVYGTEYRRFV